MVISVGVNAAETTIRPKKGTVYEAMLNGLILIQNKKFDDFIQRYCTSDYCNEKNTRLLKDSLLPGLIPLTKDCLKEEDQAIRVLHEGAIPTITGNEIELFLMCNQPLAFNLKKVKNTWYWFYSFIF